MSLLNKLFKKTPASAKTPTSKKKEPVEPKEKVAISDKPKPLTKAAEFKPGKILLAPHTAEKALAGQKLNQYIFKIASKANKISVAKEIRKTYNVKAVKVNIINIPKKARRVGKTKGFKAGYKKAVITLAKGQTIELK